MMRRSSLKRKAGMRRGGAIASRRRPARSVEEREASKAWKAAVGACSICPREGGVCDGEVQGHHVISQQALKRRGLHAWLWDLRGKVDVCTFRHEQHTSGYKPIPVDLLPDAVWAFAADVGLTWWVERFYPSSAEVAA